MHTKYHHTIDLTLLRISIMLLLTNLNPRWLVLPGGEEKRPENRRRVRNSNICPRVSRRRWLQASAVSPRWRLNAHLPTNTPDSEENMDSQNKNLITSTVYIKHQQHYHHRCIQGTGYCWCVTEEGKPVPGSSVQHSKVLFFFDNCTSCWILGETHGISTILYFVAAPKIYIFSRFVAFFFKLADSDEGNGEKENAVRRSPTSLGERWEKSRMIDGVTHSLLWGRQQ